MNFLLGVVLTIVGVLVAIAPQTSIKIVVIVLGGASICKGLYDLVRVRVISDNLAFRGAVLFRSLISIAVGLVAVCLPLAFFRTAEGVVRIVLYVQGAYLVVAALASLFMAVRLVAAGLPAKPFITEALGMVVAALLLFLLPANFGVTIVRLAGIVMAACSCLFAVYSWKNRALVLTPDSIRDAAPEEA